MVLNLLPLQSVEAASAGRANCAQAKVAAKPVRRSRLVRMSYSLFALRMELFSVADKRAKRERWIRRKELIQLSSVQGSTVGSIDLPVGTKGVWRRYFFEGRCAALGVIAREVPQAQRVDGVHYHEKKPSSSGPGHGALHRHDRTRNGGVGLTRFGWLNGP